MPLFEFQCSECNRSFEKLVFTSEDKEGIVCPTCSSSKVEIQLSAFGIGKTNGTPNPGPSSIGGGGCCGGSCGCM